jgi:hypothetical protein
MFSGDSSDFKPEADDDEESFLPAFKSLMELT